jgi:hypothetical protein
MASFLSGVSGVVKGMGSGIGSVTGLSKMGGIFGPLDDTLIKNPASGKMVGSNLPSNRWQEVGQTLGKMIGTSQTSSQGGGSAPPSQPQFSSLPEVRSTSWRKTQPYTPPSVAELLEELGRRGR